MTSISAVSVKGEYIPEQGKKSSSKKANKQEHSTAKVWQQSGASSSTPSQVSPLLEKKITTTQVPQFFHSLGNFSSETLSKFTDEDIQLLKSYAIHFGFCDALYIFDLFFMEFLKLGAHLIQDGIPQGTDIHQALICGMVDVIMLENLTENDLQVMYTNLVKIITSLDKNERKKWENVLPLFGKFALNPESIALLINTYSNQYFKSSLGEWDVNVLQIVNSMRAYVMTMVTIWETANTTFASENCENDLSSLKSNCLKFEALVTQLAKITDGYEINILISNLLQFLEAEQINKDLLRERNSPIYQAPFFSVYQNTIKRLQQILVSTQEKLVPPSLVKEFKILVQKHQFSSHLDFYAIFMLEFTAIFQQILDAYPLVGDELKDQWFLILKEGYMLQRKDPNDDRREVLYKIFPLMYLFFMEPLKQFTISQHNDLMLRNGNYPTYVGMEQDNYQNVQSLLGRWGSVSHLYESCIKNATLMSSLSHSQIEPVVNEKTIENLAKYIRLLLAVEEKFAFPPSTASEVVSIRQDLRMLCHEITILCSVTLIPVIISECAEDLFRRIEMLCTQIDSEVPKEKRKFSKKAKHLDNPEYDFLLLSKDWLCEIKTSLDLICKTLCPKPFDAVPYLNRIEKSMGLIKDRFIPLKDEQKHSGKDSKEMSLNNLIELYFDRSLLERKFAKYKKQMYVFETAEDSSLCLQALNAGGLKLKEILDTLQFLDLVVAQHEQGSLITVEFAEFLVPFFTLRYDINILLGFAEPSDDELECIPTFILELLETKVPKQPETITTSLESVPMPKPEKTKKEVKKVSTPPQTKAEKDLVESKKKSGSAQDKKDRPDKLYKYDEAARVLAASGFKFLRCKGSHETWACGKVSVTLPRHDEISRHVIADLRRKLAELKASESSSSGDSV